MTDRFDEMARVLLLKAKCTGDEPMRGLLRDALRAQHRAGQEAMREKAAYATENTDEAGIAENGTTCDPSPGNLAAAIRALPIEDTP